MVATYQPDKPSNQLPSDASTGKENVGAATSTPAATAAVDHRQVVKQEDARIQRTTAAQLTPMQLDNGTAAVPATSQPKPAEQINADEMKADAQAIYKAADAGYRLFRWADKDTIDKILEGKSDQQRQAIDAAYKTAHGISIEDEVKKFESGSDLDKFENIFHRKDADPISQNANRLHEDLVEFHEWGGRSKSEIEKDIRDTLATHTSSQVAAMDADYKQQYGTSLYSAFMTDQKLSNATKDSIGVYMSGKRDDQSTAKLIDIALKAGNIDMFEESMRDASGTARKSFLDNGGNKRIQSTFGQTPLNALVRAITTPMLEPFAYAASLKTVEHAKDYAASGQLSTLTQIKDNSGLVFNNPEGFKLAIKRMSDDERKMYFQGKAVVAGTDLAGVSKEDQEKAKQYYQQLHTALDKVTNSTTLVAMEDMIANGGQPSWVGTLARHRGLLWNDSSKDIVQDIDKMTKEQWIDCKTHPEHREEFQDMLRSLVKSPQEIARLTAEYDKKLQPDTFSKSLPAQDLVSLLNAMPRKWNGVEISADTGDAVRMVEKKFAENPQLQERIVHPQTADDQNFSAAFKDALQSAIGGDFPVFGQPLVETGHLPLELEEHLNFGMFGKDSNKTFEDVAAASAAERLKLQTDASYRADVLGGISAKRQDIALHIAEQGAVAPEDKLRSNIVGWGGSSNIVDVLGNIKPQDLQTVEAAYARKYGGSLEGDVLDKLTGQDRIEAQRTFTSTLTDEERVNIAKTETERTRSGFGAWSADFVFRSGTGAQADDTMNQTNRTLGQENQLSEAIADGQANLKKIPPKEIEAIRQHLSEQLNEAIELQNTARLNHVATKDAAADYASDAAITVAAIGLIMATAGTDTPLVVPLAMLGAGLKVGTNAALEGNDYDTSVSNVTKDAVVGGVTGAASVIGSTELAEMFGIGESAAQEGASMTLAAVKDAGLQGALKEGSEEVLENGARSIMQQALANGAKKLDQSVFTALAEQAVAPGVESEVRDQTVKLIANELRNDLTERMATGVVGWATAHALYAGSGALGGAMGGFTDASMSWDNSKTVSENLSNIASETGEGAFTGALAGSATHIVFNGTKGVVQSLIDVAHGRGGVKFIGVDDSQL